DRPGAVGLALAAFPKVPNVTVRPNDAILNHVGALGSDRLSHLPSDTLAVIGMSALDDGFVCDLRRVGGDAKNGKRSIRQLEVARSQHPTPTEEFCELL